MALVDGFCRPQHNPRTLRTGGSKHLFWRTTRSSARPTSPCCCPTAVMCRRACADSSRPCARISVSHRPGLHSGLESKVDRCPVDRPDPLSPIRRAVADRKRSRHPRVKHRCATSTAPLPFAWRYQAWRGEYGCSEEPPAPHRCYRSRAAHDSGPASPWHFAGTWLLPWLWSWLHPFIGTEMPSYGSRRSPSLCGGRHRAVFDAPLIG